jgi:Flp pilus assembly protein TadB
MTWKVSQGRGGQTSRSRVTWGTVGRRGRQAEERQLRRQRGFGSWGTQNRRLDRERRRKERQASRAARRRSSFITVVTAALLVGVVLLIAPASRAIGVLFLFGALVLYVVTRRNRA